MSREMSIFMKERPHVEAVGAWLLWLFSYPCLKKHHVDFFVICLPLVRERAATTYECFERIKAVTITLNSLSTLDFPFLFVVLAIGETPSSSWWVFIFP